MSYTHLTPVCSPEERKSGLDWYILRNSGCKPELREYMSFVKQLLKTRNPARTVFTFADLSTVAPEYVGAKLKSALKYAVKKHDITRITKGIYSLSKTYSKQEFANKYRSPSYISLYTVLTGEGIVFQPYSSLYLVANRSQEIEIDGQKYIYRKIKDEILLNSSGIKLVDGVSRATPERALCDILYLDGRQYIDNVRNIRWNVMKDLCTGVYNNNGAIATFISKHTA